MPSTSSPPAAPTSRPAPNFAHTFVHAFLRGFWTALTHTASHAPWVVAVVGLMLLAGVVHAVRTAIHTGPKDPVRRFSRADKAQLLAWAGYRCEHHTPFGRCTAIDRLEADHIHPHSRGGWTHISNGQILCKTHNQAKRAAIPFDRSLRKIEQRRQAYYPPGIDRTLVRRRSSSRRTTAV